MSSITCSLKDLAKTLDNELQKELKQVRFAAMNALNDVAFKHVRNNLESEYRKSFNVRNQSFPRAIYVIKATKDNLVAEVGYKADFMKLHATGGTRKPEGGREALTIPLDKDAPGLRSSKGSIKQRNKVPKLLEYHNQNPLKKKPKSAVKRPFVLESNGKAVVMKRAKGNTTLQSRHRDNGDEVLFAFAKEAKIEKRWDFEKIVNDTVEKELPKVFEKRFKEAMATKK